MNYLMMEMAFVSSEIDQNKDRMLEILEGKGLSFLFPLLKNQKYHSWVRI